MRNSVKEMVVDGLFLVGKLYIFTSSSIYFFLWLSKFPHIASFFTIIFVYNRKVKKNAFVYAINARGKRLRIKNGQSRETRNIGYTSIYFFLWLSKFPHIVPSQ
jgi:hypothetical protein